MLWHATVNFLSGVETMAPPNTNFDLTTLGLLRITANL